MVGLGRPVVEEGAGFRVSWATLRSASPGVHCRKGARGLNCWHCERQRPK